MTEAKRMSAETAIQNMAEACLCGYEENPPCVPCRTAELIRSLAADLEAARATALEEAREVYIRGCESAFESGYQQGKSQRSISMATIVADYGADFDHHIRALKDQRP